jgi:hypothetical protein
MASDPRFGIERFGRYWKLTYPDGGWQRTKTRGEAQRLANLYLTDHQAWVVEVAGGGAAAGPGSPT